MLVCGMEAGNIALADDYNQSKMTHYNVSRLHWNQKLKVKDDKELLQMKKIMIHKKNLSQKNDKQTIWNIEFYLFGVT